MGRCPAAAVLAAAGGRAGLPGGGKDRGSAGKGRTGRGRVVPCRAAPPRCPAGAGRFPPFAWRAAAAARPLRPEGRATRRPAAPARCIPPRTGMAGEQSPAHRGARQPAPLIALSLRRRDGLDSASLKGLRDGVWPESARRQENCSRS